MPLPFFEEPTGPALWISLLPNERWGLVVHVEFLATLNAESEGVTHAPALRVHSGVLERLALATIVLITLSAVTVSRRCSSSDLRRPPSPNRRQIQPTT